MDEKVAGSSPGQQALLQWRAPPREPGEATELLGRVEEALRGVAPDQSAEEISRWAEILSFSAHMARMKRAPHVNEAGTLKAAKALDKLAGACWALAELVHSLPLEANEALRSELEGWKSLRLANEARGLFRRHDHALGRIAFAAQLETYTHLSKAAQQKLLAMPQTTVTKPTNKGAAEMTNAAARAYLHLTGRSPAVTTPGAEIGHKGRGPFVTVLRELFEIFGFDAKAESQTRAWKRRNPPEKKAR